MTSYIFYGYQFTRDDIATKYKGLPLDSYSFQVIPNIEKYLTNSSGVKIGSLAFMERNSKLYIGYVISSLSSGYLFKDAEFVANLFSISLLKQTALIKGWKDFKLTKTEMSNKLGYYFV